MPHVTKHLPWEIFIDEYNLHLSAPIGRPAAPINEKLFKFGAGYSCILNILGWFEEAKKYSGRIKS